MTELTAQSIYQTNTSIKRRFVDFFVFYYYYLQGGSRTTHKLHRGTARERDILTSGGVQKQFPKVHSCNRQNGPSAKSHHRSPTRSTLSGTPGFLASRARRTLQQLDGNNLARRATAVHRRGGTRDEVELFFVVHGGCPLRGDKNTRTGNHWTTVANRHPPPPPPIGETEKQAMVGRGCEAASAATTARQKRNQRATGPSNRPPRAA